MENIINARELNILTNYFNGFIGTKDERQLLDVSVCHSTIGELRMGKKGQPIKVDTHEARDINFVFGNGHYTNLS